MDRLLLELYELLFHQGSLPQTQPQIGTVQALVVGVADARDPSRSTPAANGEEHAAKQEPSSVTIPDWAKDRSLS
jgi:hypothetical protein